MHTMHAQLQCAASPFSTAWRPRPCRCKHRPGQTRLSRPVAVLPQAKDPALADLQLSYLYQTDLPEGRLTITALQREWLPAAAELLADVFVDSKGIMPYRTYVRRNITNYLKEHISMPPKACVITAVVTCDLDTQARLEPLRTSSGCIRTSIDRAAAAPSSNGSSLPDNSLSSRASSSSSSSSSGGRPSRGVTRGGERFTTSGTAPTRSSLAASSGPATDSTTSTSSSSQQQTLAPETPSKAFHQLSKHLQAAFPSSGRGSSLPDAWASFLQQVLGGSSSSTGAQEDMSWEDVLVGVAEVSFDASTRSSNGSVEPPSACAYLCNMAVDPQWRRKGIASYLLAAAEELSLAAGETDMYLHLRFQDEAAAGVLYKRSGFTVARKDWSIVRFLGRDPKYLLRKPLQAPQQAELQEVVPGGSSSSKGLLAPVGLKALPKFLQFMAARA